IKLAVITVLIASASGVFGLWYLSDFQALDNWLIVIVAGASLAIWVPMSLLYYRLEYMLPLAVYIGFLSPFIGGCITLPPWSFVLLFSKPEFTISLGIGTSLVIYAVARYFAHADFRF
ncbi:MAG: hypothetical protein KDA70_21915, partial [Planctomycetaceae bacterium]|nr:hypothetical protein [Planctomycetaceae bacterium]